MLYLVSCSLIIHSLNVEDKFALSSCSYCDNRHALYIHPDFQRRGIGSALINRVIDLANSTQHSIFIRDSSEAGLPLYIARGFKQVDTLVIKGYESQVEGLASLYREYEGNTTAAASTAAATTSEESSGAGKAQTRSTLSPDSADEEAAVLVSPGTVSEGRSDDEYVSVSR
jgi:GNAT superfamily N-acetyltransferase